MVGAVERVSMRASLPTNQGKLGGGGGWCGEG
jgi:hypothetical protein